MSDIQELTHRIVEFRDQRDWSQFHHPKELASALAIEVAEIMELFRFKSQPEVDQQLEKPDFQSELGAELADSLFLLLLLAHDSGMDLKDCFEKKMALLEQRYPPEKCRGRNDKWTEYEAH